VGEPRDGEGCAQVHKTHRAPPSITTRAVLKDAGEPGPNITFPTK
jgi:hypothetical protein